MTTTTPTGVLLGRFTPGTPQWDEARSGLCVTATQIAAVMGLSPWQSRFSLWHKKAGLPTPPFEPSPRMEWGVRHEPTIAAKYEEDSELTLVETGTWRHGERAWQRATPDRLADDRIVEIKTSEAPFEWGEPGTDEVPIYYRCQVMWQMDVLGYRRTDIAVLLGLSDYRVYTVWFDEADAKVMREAAEQFLDDVRQGNRPPIDGASDTYRTIRAQPLGLDDIDVQIPVDLADRYQTTGDDLKAAVEARRQAAGEVLDLIGTGRRAVCGDRRIAYRTVNADGTTHSLQPYLDKDTAA